MFKEGIVDRESTTAKFAIDSKGSKGGGTIVESMSVSEGAIEVERRQV